MPGNSQQQIETLLNHIDNIIKRDSELREKYHIENKFRFIREQLQTLSTTLKNHLATSTTVTETITIESDTNVPIYIHLYNAQGIMLRSWQNMLTAKLLREFGFNRPIYADKNAIDSFLHLKSNKTQHAYLTILVKPEDILPPNDEALKDSLGNPLIKIKEGALVFKNIQGFTHHGQEYVLNAAGELIKK
ncbi:hypothetical protein AYO45_01510 [Gammaproteobacteria bacterium SCGC AG-212-F23]|nr:hypothetical protein AYO45_01510 [Gammaproteobacteria bacterium SCGC AG-212-F23]